MSNTVPKAIRVIVSEDDHQRLKDAKGDDRTWLEAMKEEFGVDQE